MAEIGQIMLGYLGFTVESAKNRVEAVKKIKQFYDDQSLQKPLVLLDISSSNGESGVETRRILHKIDPDLKIIAMSGTILDPIMDNCIEYGFVNALPKPYSMDSLKHILSSALSD
jgi:CheY-like chemotaxis protein